MINVILTTYVVWNFVNHRDFSQPSEWSEPGEAEGAGERAMQA